MLKRTVISLISVTEFYELGWIGAAYVCMPKKRSLPPMFSVSSLDTRHNFTIERLRIGKTLLCSPHQMTALPPTKSKHFVR
jgi:hypothetical protein